MTHHSDSHGGTSSRSQIEGCVYILAVPDYRRHGGVRSVWKLSARKGGDCDIDSGGLKGRGDSIASLAGQVNSANHGSGTVEQDMNGGINPRPLGLDAKYTRIRHSQAMEMSGIKTPSSPA
jgi:hypothetical protein